MIAASNPILPGCFPDPTICRVGEEYYLVTSTFEYLPGLPIMRSRDLIGWETIGHAIDRAGMLDLDGILSSGGLFAPTIRHDGERFWIVCTLVDSADESRGGNFVIVADDPAGPWSEPVWLDVDGIDPSLLFDDDGRVWMHGTRPARHPEWHDQTEVWLRELDPASMTLIGEEHILWHGAVLGAVWAEGPHLYKVDDGYLLLASEGGTEFHHALSVARADAVTGPYIGNRANPVLTHRHLGRGSDVVGVGHADLVQAVDGSWWAVLLAMRPYGGYHYNLGRETFLVPVAWEDGWPVFAPGSGRVPAEVEVPLASSPQYGIMQGVAHGVVRPDDPRWSSARALPHEVARPAGDGWALPLASSGPAEPVRSAFIGVRQQHRDVDVVAVASADLRHSEEAGLIVRQSEDDQVRLSLRPARGGTSVALVHRRAGAEEELGRMLLDDGESDDVELVLKTRGQRYEFSAGRPGTPGEVVAVADGRTLDTVATGGFLGLWIGVFGTSNGAPTNTVLHLRRFEYSPV